MITFSDYQMSVSDRLNIEIRQHDGSTNIPIINLTQTVGEGSRNWNNTLLFVYASRGCSFSVKGDLESSSLDSSRFMQVIFSRYPWY